MERVVAASLLLLLAPVAARPDGAELPPEATLAEVPFLDVEEPNRIAVDLAPRGSRRPFRLLLDTGASHSGGEA